MFFVAKVVKNVIIKLFGGDILNELIYEKIGERLKTARELRRITLEQAGEKVGVHKSTVLRWENGETKKINLTIIESLAKFYSVNPAWLMGHDVPMDREMNDNDTLKNVRMASYNGVDVEGLSDKEIEEIKQFVEFVRNKNKK